MAKNLPSIASSSLLISYLAVVASLLQPAASISFDFPDFSDLNVGNPCPNVTKTICLLNDATPSKNVVELTLNKANPNEMKSSVGGAVYSDPVPLWDSSTGEVTNFTTEFSFFTGAPSGDTITGDGIAFFLSPYPFTIPNNSAGRNLGLMTDVSDADVNKPSNSSKFVAVEFDTFHNFFDPQTGPSKSHMGIDVNTIVSVTNISLRQDFKAFNISYRANATVRYDAAAQNLSVSLDYLGLRYSLSHVVNLTKVLPERVSVGFSASTGSMNQVNRLASWKFNSTLVGRSPPAFAPVDSNLVDSSAGGKRNTGLVMGIVVGAVILAIGGVTLVCFALARRRKRMMAKRMRIEEAIDDLDKRGGDEEEDNDDDFASVISDDELEKERGPRKFPYKNLVAATCNFDETMKLGVGGFGPVYRGHLSNPDMDVAIKTVAKDSKQGKKEYLAEIKTISRLRHRNLVQLVGWCHEHRGDLLLVYELVPNGNLDSHLFNKDRPVLPWEARYKIAVGLASALLYLHEEWDRCVVHRDVKSSNVLLDAEFNAKLGDFGLARFADHGRGLQTTFLAGTMGYMAPECFVVGKASKESDVYSFGVVVLEIACGRRAVDPRAETARVVEWAWELYGRGAVLEGADGRLGMEFDGRRMERLMVVGLWCAHPDISARPSIREALNALNFQGTVLPELPTRMPLPTYSSYAPSTNSTTASFTASTSTSADGYSNSMLSYSSGTSTSSTTANLLRRE